MRKSLSSLAVLVLAACAPQPQAPSVKVRAIEPPVDSVSGMYSLSRGANETALLSWIAPGESNALRYSRWDGAAWSAPRTIAEGRHWFVNWVDRPAVSESGGALLAHYLERPVAARNAKFGYGVRVLRSDDGSSWSDAFAAGMDNVSDYTGFAAYLASGDEFLMAYLDPALDGSHQGDDHDAHVKTLRLAAIGTDGKVRDDVELDADVCTCCPLDVAQTSAGPAVVYRDHRAGEIRDISIVRSVGGAWTQPATVYADGWEIHGCPANGPAIAADGNRVAVAWFTAAGGTPRVRLALSDDDGASFGEALEIDEGDPLGWAGVAWWQGHFVVSWLENDPGQAGRATMRARLVSPAGATQPSIRVAAAPAGRGAGVPQIVEAGRDLVVAWRDEERVRAATLRIMEN